MDDCLKLTATQLIGAYRDASLTPHDYVEQLIAHIERWEPRLNALYGFDPESLRAAARASTQRWRSGGPRGALDGVPVTLKELIATQGMPIAKGIRHDNTLPATHDAPPAARLREDGAVLVAKTTCPDFGMLSSGLSSFHGVTRNPWNLDCNTGGSSSGAGAAAAAGFGPLHVGTDIGGSVRLPAAWCGVVGFKPTLGRIPIDPYFVGRCAGPMTRSVADAALLMTSLARTDRRDAMRLPPASIDWQDLTVDVTGLRLGVMLDAGCGMALEEPIRAAVLEAARCFEAAGATLVPLEPVMDRHKLDGLERFWRARQYSELAQLSDAERADVLPAIREWAAGAESLSGVEVAEGFQQTLAMRRASEAVFDDVDALITPTTPNVAFPAEAASPGGDPTRPFEHIVYTVAWNMGEQPAISVPFGFSADGMPLGVQLVTPRFEDHLALQLGQALERWREAPLPWPPGLDD